MPKLLLSVFILVIVVGTGYFVFREPTQQENFNLAGEQEEEEGENGEIEKGLLAETIQKKVNEVFSIELLSNPTTGYGWKVEFDKDFLGLIQNIYLPDNTESNASGSEPIVGSGGKEIFEFKGLKSGKTEIIFSYLRPWEEGVEPIEKKTYEVEIGEQEPFCGSSALGTCEEDSGCKTGGCSGQICQSVLQDDAITTCEYKDCYNVQSYNLSCGCQEDICQWK